MRSGSNSTSTSTSLSGPKSSRDTEPNRAGRVMPLALQNAARRFSGMEMFVFMGTQSPWSRNHCRRLSWLQIPCPPLNAQPDDTTGDAPPESGNRAPLSRARPRTRPARGRLGGRQIRRRGRDCRGEIRIASGPPAPSGACTRKTCARFRVSRQRRSTRTRAGRDARKSAKQSAHTRESLRKMRRRSRAHSLECPRERRYSWQRPVGDNPVLPRIATTSGSGTSTSCTTNPPRSPVQVGASILKVPP